MISGNSSTIEFADPQTFVLSPYPTVLPCNTVNPVRWLIQGTWLCATPDVHPCMAPTKISPSTGSFLPDHSSFTMMGGIYTQKQKDQYKIFRASQTAIRPLQRAMAMAASATGDSQGNLGIPISGSQIQKLSNDFAEQHLPLLYKIGPFFTKVVSIMIFISWTIAFIQGLLRLYILVLHKGCGWWIIAVFSNALFTFIMMPTTIFWKAFDEIKERLHDLTPQTQDRDPETPPTTDFVHPYNTVHRTIVTYRDDDTAKSDIPS